MFSTGDPKSFDYIGTPLEELAKTDIDDVIDSLAEHIKREFSQGI